MCKFHFYNNFVFKPPPGIDAHVVEGVNNNGQFLYKN